MSVLVVGISHNSAPVALLERVARDAEGVLKLVARRRRLRARHRGAVISTCNRLEVYADVDRFHGSVEELSRGCSSSGPASRPRRCCRTSTCTTTTARSPTCSRSPPGSTRWRSARARSSARPATRCASARSSAPSAPRSTCCSSRRCGSASAPAPRPTSTGSRRPWSAPRSTAPPRASATVAGQRVVVVGAGAMAGLAAATAVAAAAPPGHRRQPHRATGPSGSPRSTAPARPRWPSCPTRSAGPTW